MREYGDTSIQSVCLQMHLKSKLGRKFKVAEFGDIALGSCYDVCCLLNYVCNVYFFIFIIYAVLVLRVL